MLPATKCPPHRLILLIPHTQKGAILLHTTSSSKHSLHLHLRTRPILLIPRLPKHQRRQIITLTINHRGTDGKMLPVDRLWKSQNVLGRVEGEAGGGAAGGAGLADVEADEAVAAGGGEDVVAG